MKDCFIIITDKQRHFCFHKTKPRNPLDMDSTLSELQKFLRVCALDERSQPFSTYNNVNSKRFLVVRANLHFCINKYKLIYEHVFCRFIESIERTNVIVLFYAYTYPMAVSYTESLLFSILRPS
ncbi:hypothetical protein KIL84_006937 [Mauremys mutica]|uniref:Uncharacterized protein n=1 Tax=Mauremys mutica TaxID=74926 RepID=A0A9D3X058_9SAUR|nr:hypothetical protein KIL84_006937 [Mauremys mutica]